MDHKALVYKVNYPVQSSLSSSLVLTQYKVYSLAQYQGLEFIILELDIPFLRLLNTEPSQTYSLIILDQRAVLIFGQEEQLDPRLKGGAS